MPEAFRLGAGFLGLFELFFLAPQNVGPFLGFFLTLGFQACLFLLLFAAFLGLLSLFLLSLFLQETGFFLLLTFQFFGFFLLLDVAAQRFRFLELFVVFRKGDAALGAVFRQEIIGMTAIGAGDGLNFHWSLTPFAQDPRRILLPSMGARSLSAVNSTRCCTGEMLRYLADVVTGRCQIR